MKIASAQLVPCSSVVGQSVLLMDKAGKIIGQLAIIGAGSKEASAAIGEQIVEAVRACKPRVWISDPADGVLRKAKYDPQL